MNSIAQYILRLQSGQFESGLASAGSAVDGFESKITSLGGAIGMTFGLAGAAMFAKSMVDAGASVENALTGLTTLLRNADEAKSVIDNTMTDATKTPFAFEGLLAANKALIAADETAVGAREAVLNLANAIAATGGGDEELQRMVVNLQQIKNVGFASALDLKQFAYAGINLYKVLDEAGIKHGENAKITYEQITSALKQAHDEGGIYFNGLENMAGNTSVQISNLGDSLFQLKAQMFNDLKPVISETIETLAGFVRGLREAWDWSVKHRTEIKALVVGWLAMRAAALVVVPLMEGYAVATATATTATAGLAVAQTALLGPLGLVILAVGALAAAYVLAIEKTNAYYANSREQKALNAYADTDTDARLSQELVPGLMNLKEGLQKKGVSGQALYDQMYAARRQDLEMRQSALTSQLEGAKNRTEELEIQKKLTDLGNQERLLTNMYAAKFGNVMGRASTKSASARSGLSGKGAAMPSKSNTASTRATGSRSITFNIQIQDIVKQFTVNTNGVREASGKIRNVVVDALMSSINDFQRAIPE